MQRNRKHNKDKNKVNRTTEKLSFFPPLTCIINGFLIKFYMEKNIKKVQINPHKQQRYSKKSYLRYVVREGLSECHPS